MWQVGGPAQPRTDRGPKYPVAVSLHARQLAARPPTLVEQYSDFSLGTTDASVAVLAERLDTDLIVTLDRRHFSALRRPSGGSYRILPD